MPSGTLYSTIDEIIPNDSDFMKSPSASDDLSTPKATEVSLTNVTAPLIDSFHFVRYRIAASQAQSNVKLTVVLLQGSTEIAS